MRALLMAILAAAAFDVMAGDMRPGMPATIAPPPANVALPPDPAPSFARAYADANRPRIVLFWNVRLSDRTADERVAQESETTTSRHGVSQLKKSTQGDAESAELLDGDRRGEVRRVKEKRELVIDDTRVATTLSPRNAVMLERAFSAEMRRGGIAFVDRALVMRNAAARKHRAGGDSRLIEADAMKDSADWLMQVLMVPDKDAVLGWGFDVSVRSISTGVEVAALYSQAKPQGLEGQPTWIATERGFERRTPRRAPSVNDVARALANDVMDQVARSITPQTR